jgi:hypothetical protein
MKFNTQILVILLLYMLLVSIKLMCIFLDKVDRVELVLMKTLDTIESNLLKSKILK